MRSISQAALIQLLVGGLALTTARVARADDPADASALFDQGMADLAAHNIDKACTELAASQAKRADVVTESALAECFTQQGKVASAWRLWRDLATTAPTPELKADAAQSASQLEARLPQAWITLPPNPPAGLAVKINGVSVDLSAALTVPVDPGPVVAVATAPSHRDWTQAFHAAEGQHVAIEIPTLEAIDATAPTATRVATKPEAGSADVVTAAPSPAPPMPAEPSTRWGGLLVMVGVGLDGDTNSAFGGGAQLGYHVAGYVRSRWLSRLSVEVGLALELHSLVTTAFPEVKTGYYSARLPLLLSVSILRSGTWAVDAHVGPFVSFQYATGSQVDEETDNSGLAHSVTQSGGGQIGVSVEMRRVFIEIDATIEEVRVLETPVGGAKTPLSTVAFSLGYRL